MIIKVPGKRAPLCDECGERRATSHLVLDYELLAHGKVVRFKACERCVLKVAAEDARRAAELRRNK